MNLYTFGCSLTDNFGEEYKKFRGNNLPDIWPKTLSKLLNKELINLGKSSSSNYSIFRQFISISKNIKQNDILIFGWTSILRYLFVNNFKNVVDTLPNNENNYPSLKTHEEILLNRDNIFWVHEIIDYIKLINLFCDKVECKVYHWTSDDEMTKFIYKDSSNLAEKLKFIPMEELNFGNMFHYLSDQKHYEGKKIAKIIEETNGIIEDSHFGEFGHKKQANYFFKYIK